MLAKPAQIPAESGCYLFRDRTGTVIYVGKARSLAQRLANYFQRPPVADYSFKHVGLMAEAASLEWVVTHSEVDALILENELIKTHQPRYNSRLKDDKSFPYLALDFRSPFPHPYTTRSTHARNVTYYGPFAEVRPLKRTLDELVQAFPLRTCTNAKFDQHRRMGRPCLLYDLRKCSGPCVGHIGEAEYAKLVTSFGAFFEGRVVELRQRLEHQMAEAADGQNYEVAARARDGLTALVRAAAGQRIVLDDTSDLDGVVVATSGSRAAVVLYRVRGGRVVGRHVTLVDLTGEEQPVDLLERALPSLYSRAEDVPSTLLLASLAPGIEVLVEYLERVRGGRVTVRVPQRGRRRQLLALVADDATAVLEADAVRRTHDHNVRSRALQELGAALTLPAPPYRIECYDMSHLQGTNYVGSMVVFEDGLPAKGQYRRFHVRGVLGNDDVGAMREVLGRRLAHWGGGDARFPDADLLLIDGGLGQLRAASEAAREHGVSVEIAALAKREELIYRPGTSEPTALPRGSEALYLVQRVRDEAHRFAITFHRSKRGRAMLRSALDGVAGLGAARQGSLLSAFGTLEGVRAATREELRRTPGVPAAVAEALYDHLHGGPTPQLTREDPR